MICAVLALDWNNDWNGRLRRIWKKWRSKPEFNKWRDLLYYQGFYGNSRQNDGNEIIFFVERWLTRWHRSIAHRFERERERKKKTKKKRKNRDKKISIYLCIFIGDEPDVMEDSSRERCSNVFAQMEYWSLTDGTGSLLPLVRSCLMLLWSLWLTETLVDVGAEVDDAFLAACCWRARQQGELLALSNKQAKIKTVLSLCFQ